MDCDSSCWRRNTFLSCQGPCEQVMKQPHIYPNHQGIFRTFLVPWRLEQSLSIEYPMAYLRSFRTVCFSSLSTALLLEQLLQRPVATAVTWKVVGIFEEWCLPILSCTVLCHMHPRLSHETFHKAFHNVWLSWLTLVYWGVILQSVRAKNRKDLDLPGNRQIALPSILVANSRSINSLPSLMVGMQRMTRNWMPLPLNVVRWSALSINRLPVFRILKLPVRSPVPRSLLPLWALRPHLPHAYQTLAVVVPLLLVVLRKHHDTLGFASLNLVGHVGLVGILQTKGQSFC